MQKTEFLNKITGKKRFIIDYANLISGNFLYQKSLLSFDNLDLFFKNPFLGIPILFPKKLIFFQYFGKSYDYSVSKLKIKKYIFLTDKVKYTPFKNFFKNGNIFVSKIVIKKKYISLVKKIIKYNKKSYNKINFIINKFKEENVCAFQTRNIPHLGHEKIIKNLLKKYKHVVINPIIGPKKKGDIKYDILEKIYYFLIKKKYKKKVSYIPFVANMFYAGPREAIHHANIRYMMGFKNFSVGRDHAGDEGLYHPEAAINLIEKYKKFLNINIVTTHGAYFCLKCNKIVIKNECNHKNLLNISGTEFRKCLKNKIYFNYADYDMQKFIFSLKDKLFVR